MPVLYRGSAVLNVKEDVVYTEVKRFVFPHTSPSKLRMNLC